MILFHSLNNRILGYINLVEWESQEKYNLDPRGLYYLVFYFDRGCCRIRNQSELDKGPDFVLCFGYSDMEWSTEHDIGHLSCNIV